MRLAFSTLGCPDWSLEQIADNAVAYGYAGVEIRGLQAHVDLRDSPDFSPTQRGSTRRLFAHRGLKVCALGASASFADPSRRAASSDEARWYVELAADLLAPYVRVFGGKPAEGATEADAIASVAEALCELAPYAEEHGVRIVLETHDTFSTGAKVAAALARIDHPAIAALWDLHHPYREGEPPEETLAALRPYLRHLHVKDSRNGTYCLLGEGDLPVREMLTMLPLSPSPTLALWLSVEWEKRWHPGIAAPEIALPQYAATLRRYLEEVA